MNCAPAITPALERNHPPGELLGCREQEQPQEDVEANPELHG
jgi:hypothetical protein